MKFYSVIMLILAFFISGCYDSQNQDQAGTSGATLSMLSDVNASVSYAPDGKSYLKDIGPGKKLLHIEGSPYKRGYAHGYLCGEAISRMVSFEYYRGVLTDLMGDGASDIFDSKTVEKAIMAAFRALTLKNEKYIPLDLRLEMKGIADGARAAGYDVDYLAVLVLNMGPDTLLSVAYPIIVPLLHASDIKKSIPELPLHACHAYVAYGNATANGDVLMGRNFMFSPDVYHEVALLIECVPDNGNAFVNSMTPGFAGVVAGMNAKGIGIGIDMVPTLDCDYPHMGMGAGLLARVVMEKANSLDDAIQILKNAKRGTPWLYTIGDGTNRRGAVVECSADMFAVRYDDYKAPAIPDGIKDRIINDQIEAKDDLIVVSNHYILPEMSMLYAHYVMDDSLWRYKTMTGLLLDNYGRIDAESGRNIIDFLHPPAYGYYGDDPNQPVAASVSLFDLTNLRIWSLFGHFNDEWAYHQLK